MQCEVCGESNPPGNRYCQGCGTRFPLICFGCGQASQPGAAFCGGCGAALTNSARAQRDRPSAASRGVFVEAGELKQVTALFVDLVRSTELVADLDAESAMQRLQLPLQLMCEAIERMGGVVMQTPGDGVLALFGAPRAKEGHAVLACQAALAIRETLRRQGDGLSVRCGLHSGEVVAGTELRGSEQDFKAYGMTLHLASRLPGQVEPDVICLTEACRALLPAFVEVAPLGFRLLRGLVHPITLHALIGVRDAAASERFSGMALTPLIGREPELGRLQAALASEPGSVIGIVGEPGTGKSRLCHEFALACGARNIPVFAIQAQPYGVATPLRPMMEFLRTACFGIHPGQPADRVAGLIRHRLAEVGATNPVDLAIVCDFLGVPLDQPLPAWLNPHARNSRLIGIVGDLVRRRGTTPSVIMVEDLHWLDDASEAFIRALAKAVRTTQAMLVVNYRPSYDGTWLRRLGCAEIVLAQLGGSDTETLIETLVGPDPALAGVRDQIAARSAGNPFFAEELVNSLLDQGVITGRRGAFSRGQTAGPRVLPATVQAVISARIDSLSAPARDLLHIAAIIGQTFPTELLRSVAGQTREVIEATLDQLCKDRLLEPGRGVTGGQFSFCHPLIQEVAYATQLRGRRVALHAAAARALTSLNADRTHESAALIAFHYEAAGEAERAAMFAAHAARWLGPKNSTEATQYWHKVRALMAQAPHSAENDTLRIEASGQIAWVGWREGLTPEKARPFVQEALHWAQNHDDSLTPLLLLVEGRIAQVNGGPADAFVQQLRRAVGLAEARGDVGRVATLQAALSHAYGWAGLLLDALAASDRALANVDQVTDFDHQFLGYSVLHWVQALRGRILVRLGRFEAATACLDTIININGLIDPTVQFIAHRGYVDMAWCLDDAAMAAEHAAKVGQLADRHGSVYLKAYHLASTATALGIIGDYGEAIRVATECLAALQRTRAAIELEPELLASLAEYLMRNGDAGAAIRAAEAAITMAEERNARLPACRARITLAALLASAPGADSGGRAEALLAVAETLMAETGAAVYAGRLAQARRRPAALVKLPAEGGPAG